MSRPLLLIVLPIFCLFASCGDGNIGDVFDAFPAEAFEGDGGDDPGGGPPGGPGNPIEAEEVAFLEASQGVTGDVRNIALAQVAGLTLAFATAGINGIHMVDVSEPDLVNATDFRITIAPALLAGGRSDSLAVIDNRFLVTIAVGTGAANAVTVFDLTVLNTLATSPTADLTGAIVPRAAGSADIAVPGNDLGKAGGVSGSTSAFAVATGGAELGLGVINSMVVPPEWTGFTITQDTSPQVDRFLDVLLTATGLFASVQTGTEFGVIAGILNPTTTPPSLTISTPSPIPAEGEGDFNQIANDLISGPGNFPLDLALGTPTLYVSGDDEVRLFNITNLSSPPTIATRTGMDTIAVAATIGVFAVGAGDTVRVYNTLSGAPIQTAIRTFTAGFIIRGVALTSSDAGNFVLCCAGTRGLRIVRWS